MLAASFSRKSRGTGSGSALIIVLFFIILLSVVTIAFLARSLTAVRVSASSAGETKSKILASSAGDIIIGDLKQEIIAGSAANSGAANYPIYIPTSNVTMIPFQNGVPTTGTLIPNLISRSVSPQNTAGSAPYKTYSATYTSSSVPPNRAASDPTAATADATSKVNSSTPSLNGRYISPAQWNSHYLIPRDPGTDSPGSTGADSTPVSSFVPPDWVVVTRAGARTVLSTGFGSGGLNDPTLTNTNFAIGRYAYAIYNEGGLLDMNAAGYPSDPTNPGAANSNGLTSTQISKKGSLALADLTQLPASATSTVTMTQTQINNFVGWRNYASAQLTAANGSYGSFSFTPTTASNWLTNFVANNTNGFMQIVGTATPPTDQALLSRRQLISVIQSLGISPDFLQYMGTFSRALEQPSFVPETGRPGVIGTIAPPNEYASPTSNADYYQGNSGDFDQNYQGNSNFVIPTANPSFLSIRVGTGFTRFNGTTAVVGEPLVKTKFALKWLAMVAYNATNTSLPAGFAATTADPDPIYDRFGLSRTSTSSPWTYNHGQNYIMTLAEVASLSPPREPDFAELLKAAINVGSLAKGGPNLNATTGSNNYQYTVDTETDYAVLQIMANLIDQQDADSYPTSIQIGVPGVGAVSYYRTFYGVEDLPYFYRYHPVSVVDVQPVPLLARTQAVTFSPGSSGYPATTPLGVPDTNTYTFNWVSPASAAPLTNPGDVALLYIPEIWNPHDPSTQSTAGTRPQLFRMVVTTNDPIGLTGTWQIGAQCNLPNFNATDGPPFYVSTQGIVPVSDYPTASTPIAFDPPTAATPNTALTFTDVNGTLFREPTLLWRPNYPAGVTLTAVGSATGKITDAVTGQTYVGVIAGKTPISTTFTVGPSSPGHTASDGTYVFQGNSLSYTTSTPGGTFPQLTFTLQYQDKNSNWVTYDVKYPDLHGMASPALLVNSVDFPAMGWGGLQNPLQGGIGTGQIGDTATGYDPRTARYGVGTSDNIGYNSGASPALEPAMVSSFGKNTSGATTTLTGSNFTIMESQRPRQDRGDYSSYSGPAETINAGRNQQMRWFSGSSFSATATATGNMLYFDGMLEQNNPLATILERDNATSAGLFIEDPDGVARRAMGAYASTTIATTPSASGTIGLPAATANTYAANNGVGAATSQAQSRPIILNRPFHSVSEMSYAFKGSPWKNIDFFTPESGDSALLDTFCLNDPPPTAMIAGRVDLNTRQAPVLKAIVAGAYRDEFSNVSSPPSYALPAITGPEAANLASKLVAITSAADAWRGPLPNVSALVGRYVATPGTLSAGTIGTDWYTYAQNSAPSGATAANTYTYSGLSALLDSSNVYTSAAGTSTTAASSPYIQRFREAGLRPLIDAGQVRVWNLLIDVVAQTGHYPKTATGLDQFSVDGQTRFWVHVAIDRYTGQVIDKQVEVATP
jgi:hypothetical protein